MWIAILAALVSAGPARAVTLYFDGNLGVGLDAADPDVVALGVDLVLDGSYAFLSAGSPSISPLLEVTTSLVGVPTVPATPSFADPILATVQYTVTNTTGAPLAGDYLAFTYSGLLDAYPQLDPEEFGIDVPGIALLQTASCSGNPGGPCVFGAVALPALGPGGVFQFQITHVLADSLSGSTVIPTPSVALVQQVPEPAAALLVGSALLALALRRRE
jgi:hypothetical protein